MKNLWVFLKRLGRKLWALLSCALFTILSVVGYRFNKDNHWFFWSTLAVSALCLLIACYQVWLDEFIKLEGLGSDGPDIRIEPLTYTWIPDKDEKNNLVLELYIYVRLSNTGKTDTSIQQYSLRTVSINGTTYNCRFNRRIPPILPFLPDLISVTTPLKRGIHVEGWLRFDFVPGNDDPVSQNRLNADCEITVKDGLGIDHTSGLQRISALYDQLFKWYP